MLAVFLLPIVMPQASAHELVPVIPGGPTTYVPPISSTVHNYVYPSGKTGQVYASSDKPVVAYSEYKYYDYIMSVIVTLESLFSDTDYSREATLMVSVFYTYAGSRSVENLGGLANVKLGMSKTYSTSSVRTLFAAEFTDK